MPYSLTAILLFMTRPGGNNTCSEICIVNVRLHFLLRHSSWWVQYQYNPWMLNCSEQLTQMDAHTAC